MNQESTPAERAAPPRACGACSLCCTLLRVDELAKLAGTPCLHQRTPASQAAASEARSEPQASGVRAPARASEARSEPQASGVRAPARASEARSERKRSAQRAAGERRQAPAGPASGVGEDGGCSIHPVRPAICRRYRCLWLQGSLEPGDRPDRLGAVLDLASRGGFPELVVHEAEPDAVRNSPRLREIVERYRSAMPVRIPGGGSILDPDRGFRVLLPGGEEIRVAGDRVETWRAGVRVGARRLPWLERLVRRVAIAARSVRLRPHRRGPRSAGASRRGK